MSAFASRPMPADDLSLLFTNSLSLSANAPPPVASNPAMPVYTSTHYTPPTSFAVPATSSSSAPPPARHHLSNDARLRANGIDPNSLSPSQMQLFRISSTAQQTRLLDLWRSFPVSLPGEDPANAWTPTTVETEESRAMDRFRRLAAQDQVVAPIQEQQMDDDDAMSDDGPAPVTPVTSAPQERAWAQQDMGGWINTDEDPFSEDGCGGSCAPEPYMTSGYEQLMRRDAEILRQREEEQRRLAKLDAIVAQREMENGAVQYRAGAFDKVYSNGLVQRNIGGDYDMEM